MSGCCLCPSSNSYVTCAGSIPTTKIALSEVSNGNKVNGMEHVVKFEVGVFFFPLLFSLNCGHFFFFYFHVEWVKFQTCPLFFFSIVIIIFWLVFILLFYYLFFYFIHFHLDLFDFYIKYDTYFYIFLIIFLIFLFF